MVNKQLSCFDPKSLRRITGCLRITASFKNTIVTILLPLTTGSQGNSRKIVPITNEQKMFVEKFDQNAMNLYCQSLPIKALKPMIKEYLAASGPAPMRAALAVGTTPGMCPREVTVNF